MHQSIKNYVTFYLQIQVIIRDHLQVGHIRFHSTGEQGLLCCLSKKIESIEGQANFAIVLIDTNSALSVCNYKFMSKNKNGPRELLLGPGKKTISKTP